MLRKRGHAGGLYWWVADSLLDGLWWPPGGLDEASPEDAIVATGVGSVQLVEPSDIDEVNEVNDVDNYE